LKRLLDAAETDLSGLIETDDDEERLTVKATFLILYVPDIF